MDMSYIMNSDQNRVYTTFSNILLLISDDPADLSHMQKNHFSKKIMIFWSKICSRGTKSGSIGIARYTVIREVGGPPYLENELENEFWTEIQNFSFPVPE